MHIFRWDLDRTYLDTEIRSVRGLVRAALEDAADKRTVPGAAALLRGLCAADPTARVVILSGSPVQMREVLLQKLALDGIRVDELVLKDNLRNLRRGRLRAVRGQIGFKLPLLLEDRAKLGAAASETLFGDDSEADALIYAAYAALLAGELDEPGLLQVLRAGDAYPDMIERAVVAARAVRREPAVNDIFIRVDRGLPLGAYSKLGALVRPVFSWLQAALVLRKRGAIGDDVLTAVAEGIPAEAVGGLIADAVRRGLVGHDDGVDAARVLTGPQAERTARDLARMGPVASPSAERPDYLGFLDIARRSS